MKYLTVFFLLICFCCKAQDKATLSSKILNTNFNISHNTKVQDLNSGGAETFIVVSDEKKFEYSFTINKFPIEDLPIKLAHFRLDE